MFAFSQITITQNTTWDNNFPPPIAAQYGITIDSGAYLMISCNMQFYQGASITVKAGTRLYIVDANLSRKTGSSSWTGIIVQGTPNQIQSLSNSGIVTLSGTSKIIFAEIGIESNDGGIIKARKNTQFLNCNISIKFNPYLSPDPTNVFSLFDECTFKWNSNYTGTPNTFVILDNVSRIEFQGCTFINEKDWPSNFGGIGIQSINSSFNVMKSYSSIVAPSPCIIPNGEKTAFLYLTKGIDATFNLDPENDFRYINILESNFINNQYGINLNGCRNLMIYGNYFETNFRDITDNSLPSGYIYTRGINGQNIADFVIENDTFLWTQVCTTCRSSGVNCFHRGISINYLVGAIGNSSLVRNNYFCDSSDGCAGYSVTHISGTYLKWPNNNNSNLHLTCNRFNIDDKDYFYDLELDNGYNCNLEDQGSVDVSAGNIWTIGHDDSSNINIHNTETNCNYYYKNDIIGLRYNPKVTNISGGTISKFQSVLANECDDGGEPCDIYGTQDLPKNDMKVDNEGNLVGLEDLNDVPVPEAEKRIDIRRSKTDSRIEFNSADIYIYNSIGLLVKVIKTNNIDLTDYYFKSLIAYPGIYIILINDKNNNPIIKKLMVF